MNREFLVYPSAIALAAEAALFVQSVIEDAVNRQGRCCLALSGGTTPRLLFEQLSQPKFHDLPWESVALFWSDERFVPESHADSNYRLAKEELLERLPVQPRIFPVNTAVASPQVAALSYERTMRELFKQYGGVEWPCFDCILLGVGADGHTASLFPGDKAVQEIETWATVGQAPNKSYRITLTLPVINAAKKVIFMATGPEKAEVVGAISSGNSCFPAAKVQAEKVIWLLDAAAAANLTFQGE